MPSQTHPVPKKFTIIYIYAFKMGVLKIVKFQT